MENLKLTPEARDDFDSVKHVLCNCTGEIYSIERLENELYQLQSIDSSKDQIVLTNEDLQEGYIPIELKEHWLFKPKSLETLETVKSTSQRIHRVFYDFPNPVNCPKPIEIQ
jgi:hypothetical protein